jgi:hypothetical protein
MSEVISPLIFGTETSTRHERNSGNNRTDRHFLRPFSTTSNVLPDGGVMYVYDMDHDHALVKKIQLPVAVTFVRGFGADPASHALVRPLR